ncbi:MAG: VOC family protein [Gammaproteobacteria bacterium]
MSTSGFSHYNLRAPRELLELLRLFYCDVVGLSVGERPPFRNHGYWLYAEDHDILHLTEAATGEVRATDVDTTFDHVAFKCSGLTAFESNLRAHGIAFETDHVPLTGRVQLFLKDPAGNGVELNFAGADA